MPKLSKAKQKSVAKAEGSSFEAIPAGRYIATLAAVVADKDGKPLVGQRSGEPYWRWEFSEITGFDGTTYAGKQFVNTSLSDAADWKMQEVFDAFGYSYDSDTDEMVGEKVILHITQRPIAEGERAGEMGNNVGRVAPYNEGEEPDDWDGE